MKMFWYFLGQLDIRIQTVDSLIFCLSWVKFYKTFQNGVPGGSTGTSQLVTTAVTSGITPGKLFDRNLIFNSL